MVNAENFSAMFLAALALLRMWVYRLFARPRELHPLSRPLRARSGHRLFARPRELHRQNAQSYSIRPSPRVIVQCYPCTKGLLRSVDGRNRMGETPLTLIPHSVFCLADRFDRSVFGGRLGRDLPLFCLYFVHNRGAKPPGFSGRFGFALRRSPCC